MLCVHQHMVVDAHCHIGELLDRTRSSDLQSVLEEQPGCKEEFIIDHVISNHCFDNKWKTKARMEQLQTDSRIHCSIGIHPRFVSDKDRWQMIQEVEDLIQSQKVVALGEIGLDFSDPNISHSRRRAQQCSLELVTPLAVKYHLPVILHNRGSQKEGCLHRCLEILSRTLPPDHPIHVHCFSGTPEEDRKSVV